MTYFDNHDDDDDEEEEGTLYFNEGNIIIMALFVTNV